MIISLVFFLGIFEFFSKSIKSSVLHDKNRWNHFKKMYGIEIPPEEDKRRMLIFLNHSNYINKFNKRSGDLKLAINKFAHLESKELPPRLIIPPHSLQGTSGPKSSSSILPVPQHFDWRHYGVVSPVMDQGHCGSCYAFAAAAAIESSFSILTGVPVSISKQQIVDCSVSEGNMGCFGGWPTFVYDYAMHHAIYNNNEYKYHAKKGWCRVRTANLTSGLKLLSYALLEQGNENELIRAVAFRGPVVVAIDANHLEFRFYKEGVIRIKDCSSEELDHAVTVVGYQLGENPHYIIKNSWGKDWGMNGYFHLALNADNMCGVATAASYPISYLPSENPSNSGHKSAHIEK